MTVVLAGMFTVALAVGVVAIHGQRAADRQFAQRTAARAALNQMLVESDQGAILAQQAASSATLSGPSDPTAIGALTRATKQQQAALSDWNHFEVLSQSWNGGGPHAGLVDEDLGRAAGITGSALKDNGRSMSLTPHSLALVSGLVEQVSADGTAIRTADIAWWAAALARQKEAASESLMWLELTGAAALITLIVGDTVVARTSRRREQELVRRESALAGVAVANEFEARLQRALEMADNEDGVHRVTREALDETVPQMEVEVLLADSSRAHFHRVVETGGPSARRCSVESPGQCPSARRGEVLAFSSSRALDACPYLKEHADACSSVCVPVSVSGTTVGVVHAASTVDRLPDGRSRALLELIARRASDRIGMMRAFARTEVQANTDSLTGLRNRRALENEVRGLAAAGTPYAVAFGDLDRFKMLNDVHGHGAGDQALRVFASVLREAIRPGDLAGRYGGEEFVLALPYCDDIEATEVLQRVRERLAATLSEVGGPTFTVSFGLAVGQTGLTFEALITAADGALLEAKALGRDRIVVAAGYTRPSSGEGPEAVDTSPAPIMQTAAAGRLSAL